MDELLRAFSLGNAAILTNACLLPLYPGLIAFLAGNTANDRTRRATGWLGILVLAGILTMMTLVGFVLYLLNQSFGDALGILLPVIYGIVILSGVLMLLDRNPFARLAGVKAPIARNPYMTAYGYGLLFGPMTLPCTGPIILSAFALGAGSARELADGLLFFLAFGLGFGWPLALLPLAALPIQRRLVALLAHNHLLLSRVAGVLLVGVGLFGIFTELLPRYVSIDHIVLEPQTWTIYWAGIALITVALAIFTYRHQHPKENDESL
jgi:cytochrome c-type biogenesis protein